MGDARGNSLSFMNYKGYDIIKIRGLGRLLIRLLIRESIDKGMGVQNGDIGYCR